MFNETLSMNKRNSDRELFHCQNISPINSLGLNPFAPINAKESPYIQRIFNFNADVIDFTPTPNGVYGFNRFNFSSSNFLKPPKTPHDI